MSEVIVEELFDELYELARWEGCETGALCFSLIDFWESHSNYTSPNLRRALEQEIRDLYDTLKERKREDDAYMNVLKSQSIPAIKIVIDDVTFSFSPTTYIDPHRHEDIAGALEEFARMLKAPVEEDKI